ncbi:Alkaline ceramidase 3 [Actinomortierella wolfii]|nr:Alkaline ceramidase 3 [Actinomortierella wolfii]
MPSTDFDKVGYWSPNTASVDWCENNYVVSYYIAEFWNTISSLYICLIGELGFFLSPTREKRLLLIMKTITIVGIGSTAFHGTLRHKMQVHELPMLYAATAMVFTLVEVKHGPQGRWFPIGLALWIASITLGTSIFGGKTQFLFFQGSFGILQLLIIAYTTILYRQQNVRKDDRWLLYRALAFYFTGVTVWLIDLHLCEFINGVSEKSVLNWNPQFHAFWHVLSSTGVYFSALLVSYQHYVGQGKQPYIYWWKGVVPAIGLKGVTDRMTAKTAKVL